MRKISKTVSRRRFQPAIAAALEQRTLLSTTYVGVDLYSLSGSSQNTISGPEYAASGNVVGQEQFGSSTEAALWTGVGGAVNLQPSTAGTSYAYGLDANHQVGMGSGGPVGANSHAFLWSGTAASAVDLNPSQFNSIESVAFGISGSQQVGYFNPSTGDQDTAVFWNGTAGSAVNLKPSFAYLSQARATDGTHQVGFGNDGSGHPQAIVWSGTAASAVDLAPGGSFYESYGTGVSGDEQVGYADDPAVGSSAFVWHGTAASGVNLGTDVASVGIISSQALATNGMQEVGSGDTTLLTSGPEQTSYVHALLWSQTANSVVDLHQYLPAGFIDSWASSIDTSGNIYGYAIDTSGVFHAVEWTQTATAPASPVVNAYTGVSPLITWTAVPGATSYNIYRQLFGGTETLLATGVTGTQYTDTSVVAPNSYYYSVRAVNGSQPGPESNQVLTGTFYPGSIPFVNQLAELGIKEGTSYNMLRAEFDDSSAAPLTTLAATINWGDGTSSAATFDYNSSTKYYELNGQHTWQTAGTFTLTIHLTDPAGGSDITLTQTQFVQDVPLTAVPTTISATAGKQFSGIVGSFSDAAGTTDPSNYSVLILWGDTDFSVGTVTYNSKTGQFDVSGSHTYASSGSYPVQLAVSDAGGSYVNVNSTANVSGTTPPVTSIITATGGTFSATRGISVSPVLATFTDSHTGQAASHYTASINWGDSTTSVGTVALVNGKFQVTGTHTYSAAGTFTATINITDPEGGSASPTSKATVSNPVVPPTSVLTAAGTTFTATKGISVSPVLATFTDSHTGQAASHYAATINWGDSTTSSGTISLLNGKFQVSGTHTYNAAGTFTATINISDPEGGSAAPTSKGTVNNPVVTPPGGSVLKGTAVSTAGTKGLPFAGLLLATFSDTKTGQPASAYTTSINWGDGSTSAGTVTFNATSKLFQVTGAHTYHKAATFNPVISISDTSGGSTSVTSKLYIADSVMHAFSTTITATAGKAFTGVVGSFTDGDPSDVASDFSATINWGDGHTSVGTVSLNPTTKRFDISGTNTYSVGGTYTITATPSDVGGMSVAIKSAATVSVIAGPQPKISGAATVKEGSSEAISFSATDMGNKAITKWSIDWGDGTVQNLAGTATSASHTYVDGPATRLVKATATDAANLSAAATLSVGVLNVAPTATFTGGSSVLPNHASTVSFSNVKDPSTADTAAGFRYSFDFNNDGKFEIVNGTSATATVPAIYLATLGVKTIHGRVSDKDGGFTDYYTTIDVISQPLTTFGTTIKAAEGTKFTGNIGSFADPSGNTNPVIYITTITWGDGHTSTGTVAYNVTTKRFGVSGTNTYALSGNFVIAVQVKSNAGAAGTIQSTASISDATITATGSNVSGKEGVSLLGVVATFTDSNPLAVAANYVISINWGDGSAASAETASFNSSTQKWQVTGSHTYRAGGTYTVTTSISDHGTSTAKATSSATIAGSTLKATGVQLSILNSLLVTTPQKIATFTTSNPLLTASDFSATVDWGDGTTTNPTSTIAIVYDSVAKVFDVMVTHPYSLLLKTYTATITITEGKGASTTTATSTIFTK